MAFFEWNDDMSVGAHLIDSDHRALISIINEMHDMLETEANVDHAVMARHFKELVTYTQYHFSREESMLRAVRYEQLSGHTKSHGSFTQFVYDMRNRLAQAVERKTMIEVLNYLKRWLNHHILIEDAAYKPFIQDNLSAVRAGGKFGPGLAEVRGDEATDRIAAD
jgi:hemerythrin-like metal-binding protein